MQLSGYIKACNKIVSEVIKESNGSIDFSIINYTTKFIVAFKTALSYEEEKRYRASLDEILDKFHDIKLKNLEDKFEELKNNV